MIEDLVYAMMEKFKNTPLELDNAMPKELYAIVENKWHYCLNLEKEIRESTLGQVMLELIRGKITKANKKYGNQFAPKYRDFSILQNQIEDFVKKSTQMLNLTYGLTTIKEGEEGPFEGRNNEEEDEDKDEETKKEKEETTEEETLRKSNEIETTIEQKIEHNAQDTQLPTMSPQHEKSMPIDTITIKDVPNNSPQNINPLIIEDLKKILD